MILVICVHNVKEYIINLDIEMCEPSIMHVLEPANILSEEIAAPGFVTMDDIWSLPCQIVEQALGFCILCYKVALGKIFYFLQDMRMLANIFKNNVFSIQTFDIPLVLGLR